MLIYNQSKEEESQQPTTENGIRSATENNI